VSFGTRKGGLAATRGQPHGQLLVGEVFRMAEGQLEEAIAPMIAMMDAGVAFCSTRLVRVKGAPDKVAPSPKRAA